MGYTNITKEDIKILKHFSQAWTLRQPNTGHYVKFNVIG